MKAILYGEKSREGIQVKCVYFPEVDMVSIADRSSILREASKCGEIEFFKGRPGLELCEVDVPFGIVARMYCILHDFSPSKMKAGNHELWNQHVKPVQRTLWDEYRKFGPSKR